MDEMVINLRTKFMRKVVSKLISKSIKSKTGYEVDVQFNEMNASFEDGEITVKANLEAKMGKDEFVKILKSQVLKDAKNWNASQCLRKIRNIQ